MKPWIPGMRLAAAALIAGLVLAAPAKAPAGEPSAAPVATDSLPGPAPVAKEKAAPKQKTKKASKQKAKKAVKEAGAKGEEGAMAGTMPVRPEVMPQHVQVQHILIGFRGSVPGKNIQRSKEEAKKLAYEILERARKGEDFGALVRQYTDDSPPGIYGMSGVGVPPGPNEYPRDRMVPAFGNVGFNISPGNIGIADYDPQTSPYGWHIIKRLQ